MTSKSLSPARSVVLELPSKYLRGIQNMLGWSTDKKGLGPRQPVNVLKSYVLEFEDGCSAEISIRSLDSTTVWVETALYRGIRELFRTSGSRFVGEHSLFDEQSNRYVVVVKEESRVSGMKRRFLSWLKK